MAYKLIRYQQGNAGTTKGNRTTPFGRENILKSWSLAPKKTMRR